MDMKQVNFVVHQDTTKELETIKSDALNKINNLENDSNNIDTDGNKINLFFGTIIDLKNDKTVQLYSDELQSTKGLPDFYEYSNCSDCETNTEKTFVSLSATDQLTEAGGTITYTASVNNPAQEDLIVTLDNDLVITILAYLEDFEGNVINDGLSGTNNITITDTEFEDIYQDYDVITRTIINITDGGFAEISIKKDPYGNAIPAETTIVDTIDTISLSMSSTGDISSGDDAVFTLTLSQSIPDDLIITLTNNDTVTLPLGQTTVDYIVDSTTYGNDTEVVLDILSAVVPGKTFENLTIDSLEITVNIAIVEDEFVFEEPTTLSPTILGSFEKTNYSYIGGNSDDNYGKLTDIWNNIGIIARGQKVWFLDVTTQIELFEYTSPFSVFAVAINANYAFIYMGSNGLEVIDLTTFNVVRTINTTAGHDITCNSTKVVVSNVGYKDTYDMAGIVYVYNIDDGSLFKTIRNPETNRVYKERSWFGFNVSANETSLMISAPYANDDKGRVYRNDISSTSTYCNKYDDTYHSNDSYYGLSVAINKTGAGNTYTAVRTREHGYVGYATTSSIYRNLPIIGAVYDYSGNFIIIGDPDYSITDHRFFGRVVIYNVSKASSITINNPNENKTNDDTYDSDHFGSSIAIHGNYALIGAEQEDSDARTNSGKVYIVKLS